MKIRDGHATLSNDLTVHTMPSNSLEILSEDDRTLFSIRLNKDASISIVVGSSCRHQGKVLDDAMDIRPISSNVVTITRPVYKPQK